MAAALDHRMVVITDAVEVTSFTVTKATKDHHKQHQKVKTKKMLGQGYAKEKAAV